MANVSPADVGITLYRPNGTENTRHKNTSGLFPLTTSSLPMNATSKVYRQDGTRNVRHIIDKEKLLSLITRMVDENEIDDEKADKHVVESYLTHAESSFLNYDITSDVIEFDTEKDLSKPLTAYIEPHDRYTFDHHSGSLYRFFINILKRDYKLYVENGNVMFLHVCLFVLAHYTFGDSYKLLADYRYTLYRIQLLLNDMDSLMNRLNKHYSSMNNPSKTELKEKLKVEQLYDAINKIYNYFEVRYFLYKKETIYKKTQVNIIKDKLKNLVKNSAIFDGLELKKVNDQMNFEVKVDFLLGGRSRRSKKTLRRKSLKRKVRQSRKH